MNLDDESRGESYEISLHYEFVLGGLVIPERPSECRLVKRGGNIALGGTDILLEKEGNDVESTSRCGNDTTHYNG